MPHPSSGWILRKNTALSCIDRQGQEERDRILLEQLPQVRYLARRIHGRLPQQVPFEDLLHAGIIGLIDALDKFDPSNRVKFGTYASFRIRGAILDSLREMDWGSRELRRKARQIEEAKRKLRVELSRTPTDVEIAETLKLDLLQFQHLLTKLNGLEVISLNLESPWDHGGEDLGDSLPAPIEDTPFVLCMLSERKQILAGVIAELPQKEQKILALYYWEELTMKQVGAIMGIGESRVSQIHSLTVARLRERLHNLPGETDGAGRASRRELTIKAR